MDNPPTAIESVVAASREAGSRAHSLNVTNHLVGRYEFETRFVFRSAEGARLSTATVKRSRKYMATELETSLVEKARKHADNLKAELIRINREPVVEFSYWPAAFEKKAA